MDSPERGQPLHYNLEVLANLIYLARRCESEQQHQYMERAESLATKPLGPEYRQPDHLILPLVKMSNFH
jgi:hypothetical protein